MKKGPGFFLSIAGAMCVIFMWAVMDARAQDDMSAISRQQRIQLANEHYAKGKELNQRGDFTAANEEFQKAQDLLAGVATGEALSAPAPVAAPSEQASVQAAPATVAAVPSAKSKKSSKAKQKKELSQVPVLPAEVQKESENYFRAAIEASKNGDPEQALVYYKKAVSLTPNNPSLLYNMAVEYLKLSRFEEAAYLFKAVVELNPKEKDAYYNLGVIYDSYLGDKDQAKVYYNKYLKLATKGDDIREVKGWISQIDKDKKELQ